MNFYRFYFIVFYIFILLLQCFVGLSYTSETEGPYRGYKTLWEPYTQRYPTIMLRSQINMLDKTSAPGKTTYFTFEENYKTPYFMKDDYNDNEQPLGIKKSNVFVKEMPVYKSKPIYLPNPRRHRLPPIYRINSSTLKTVAGGNTSCYVCGLDLPGIPPIPSCYHIFERSAAGVYAGLKNKYKKRCITGTRKTGKAASKKIWYGNLYRGGCFKRFTDVGVEYNERGCREKNPVVGLSFASKRFAKLEKILYDVDEGCVASPMASLTPFSRAISLYVRYHVCVCKGKYCNRAPSVPTKLPTIILSRLLLFISIKCFT